MKSLRTRALLVHELFYIFIFISLIIVHESAHLVVAHLEGLTVTSVELLGLSPHVSVVGTITDPFFLLSGVICSTPVPLLFALKDKAHRAEWCILAIAVFCSGLEDVLMVLFNH